MALPRFEHSTITSCEDRTSSFDCSSPARSLASSELSSGNQYIKIGDAKMQINANKSRARWKPHIYDVVAPSCFLLMVAIFLGTFFGRFGSQSSENSGFDCAADGRPIMPKEKLNTNWDPRLWLSVTLAFGSFSFSTAKAIDVFWDLIVGRGGQLLLSYLAYSTIRRSLAHSMTRTSWHLPVTTRLTFDPVTLTGLWVSLKDLTKRSWSWRLYAFTFMVVYLLSFATIVSAMTGYRANSTPYYQQSPTQTIRSSALESIAVDAVVVGCDRIRLCQGKGKASSKKEYPLLPGLFATEPNQTLTRYQTLIRYKSLLDNCTNLRETLLEGYGTCEGSTEDVRIDWMNSSRGSYSGLYEWRLTESFLLLDGERFHLSEPPLQFRSYTAEGSPFYHDESHGPVDPNELRTKTICQPESTYQWGVSSFLLFVFCWMTFIYASVVLILHYDIWSHSHYNHIDQHMSIYRDILNMALEIKNELGDNAEIMSARELDTKIMTRTGKIRIKATSSYGLTGSERYEQFPTTREQLAASCKEHYRQWAASSKEHYLQWTDPFRGYICDTVGRPGLSSGNGMSPYGCSCPHHQYRQQDNSH